MSYLINVGALPEPLKRFEYHNHFYWEISYYTHGNGTNRIGDKEYTFQEGDIIIQPPYIFHEEYSEDGFQDIFVAVKEIGIFKEKVYIFHDNSSVSFYKVLQQLNLEYHKKEKNWEQITQALFNVLIEYLIAWKTDEGKNPYVESFKEVLVNNIGTLNFKIKNVLQDIPISNDHFGKLFKDCTGLTPIQYLINLRINQAKRFLENEEKISIKQTAFLVGYSDPYYFSRIFKKYTGKSPTEWAGRG